MNRAQKRHFQLLEWMIAVFILLVCMAPALRAFISIHQAQQALSREYQRDHLAHLLHAHLTEQLYKGEVALEQIVQGTPIAISDAALTETLNKQAYAFEGKLFIVHTHTPLGEESPDKYLGKVEIRLSDLLNKGADASYDYDLFIDARKAKGGAASRLKTAPNSPSASPASITPPAEDEDAPSFEEEEDEDDL